MVAPLKPAKTAFKLPKIPRNNVDSRPNSLENISTSSTGNIKMKQFLCVRHSLPKTRISKTILHDNVNEDRHLEMNLSTLSCRRNKTSLYMDINKRVFENNQLKKQEKWKREDLEALASWNLPSLKPVDAEVAPQSTPHKNTMYTFPTYSSGKTTKTRKPIRPMLKVFKERTEIVFAKDRTFVTNLPQVVEIDYDKLNHFNNYTGKTILQTWSKDDRFRNLYSNLQPAILKKWDQYPLDNLLTKSRVAQFANKLAQNRKRRSVKQGTVVLATRTSARHKKEALQ